MSSQESVSKSLLGDVKRFRERKTSREEKLSDGVVMIDRIGGV